jgi:hypothetical protein
MHLPHTYPTNDLPRYRLRGYGTGVMTAALAELSLILSASRGRMGSGHPSGWVALALVCAAAGSGVLGGLAARLHTSCRRGRSFWQGLAAAIMPLVALPMLDIAGLTASTPAMVLLSVTVGAASVVLIGWFE